MRPNALRAVRSAAKHASIRSYSSLPRQWSTPLAKGLAEAITTTGPVSVAAYMRHCLLAPNGGYYTSPPAGSDQFGAKGDFVTSPEISQVFGELVGIWLIAEWIAQGRPEEVQIIELGPGRGTLMADVLRTLKRFPVMKVDEVFLVEASPHLREAQRKLLCGDAAMKEIDIGHQSGNVIWCEDIKFVPQRKTPFIIAHEFFDALPIHVFQNIPNSKWHELVVSPATDKDTEFQLTVSKAPTPHSMYLPTTSPRYTALSKVPNAIIEISPESHTYVSEMANRIGQNSSGAALILDYGTMDTIPANTLRGIRKHKLVSPLSAPGEVDLSADVDFMALAEAAINASPNVEVHGPVEQAQFLNQMGIEQRAKTLIDKVKGQEDSARIETGWKRLVDRGPTGMGRIYKAMAILPHKPGSFRRPVGFGGDVVVQD